MKRLVLIAILALALTSCRRSEPSMQPLDQYQSADLQATGNNFYVYSGARFLPEMTSTQRKAHFILHPGATAAPPIATYESDAPVNDIAKFYAEKYGYPAVAANETNNFSSVPPRAYYRSGDLAADARAGAPFFTKLGLKTDVSKAVGSYTGAQISPKTDFPRVTIQRPYFDPMKSVVVNKTIIIMVKE